VRTRIHGFVSPAACPHRTRQLFLDGARWNTFCLSDDPFDARDIIGQFDKKMRVHFYYRYRQRAMAGIFEMLPQSLPDWSPDLFRQMNLGTGF
jgi:hypothetical protein